MLSLKRISNVQSFIFLFAVKHWFLIFATAARFPNRARYLSDSKLLVGSLFSSSLVNKLSSVARGGFDKQNFLNPYSLPVQRSKTRAVWKQFFLEFYNTYVYELFQTDSPLDFMVHVKVIFSIVFKSISNFAVMLSFNTI